MSALAPRMILQLPAPEFSAWCDAASQPSSLKPVVLDVREAWEVQTAAIKPDGVTLVHMPMRDIPARLAELQASLGLDHPIACLCHHGIRSFQVANYLAHNGFTGVVNMQGGIAAWSQQVDPAVPQY